MKEKSPTIFASARPAAGWSVVQRRFLIKRNTHYESLFTIGSGYLNVRSCLPEGLGGDVQNESILRMSGNVTLERFRVRKSKWGVYVPGFMDRHPLLNEEAVNLPFLLGLTVEADGEKLDMQTSTIRKYSRWIDLHDGCEHRRLVWRTRSGKTIEAAFHSYVHMRRRQLVWQGLSVSLVRGGRCRVRVCGFLDGDVRTNGFDHFSEVQARAASGGRLGVLIKTHGGKHAAVVSRIFGAGSWRAQAAGRSARQTATLSLKHASPIFIQKISAIATSLESKDPLGRAQDILDRVRRKTAQELYFEHEKEWRRIWSNARMEIHGDRKADLALRFSMFHMIRANPRNRRAAICAKMNGGDAYYGRVHWDNEIFIAPFFIYTLPAWARPLVEYRCKTLKGARLRARSLGYPGAMYAWESGSTGKEECACFQYADHEVHISSDVVLGLWHYICAAKDKAFLAAKALEVIFEVARFWAARIDRRPGSSTAHILCVMGPDEYSHASDDNAFTNFTAGRSLALAGELFALAGKDKALKAVAERLAVTSGEARKWADLSRRLVVPYDAKRSLVLQSSDFENKAIIDFDTLWKNRRQPFGRFVSQERLYRSRALKQADVLMLMQLYPLDFSKKEMQAALSYYEPYTTHDSSLSVTTHAIICAWLGLREKARRYFEKACEIDLGPGLCSAAEGVHSANAGALWQCVVFGFLGVEPAYQTGTLTLRPNLPQKWESVELNLAWHGVPVGIQVQRQKVLIRTRKPLPVCVNGRTVLCRPERTEVFRTKGAAY